MVGTPARDFEWLEVLGRGCSGVCRKVRDKNGVLMVVKQIDLSFVAEEEHQNAEREARLLSSLSHPNIIRFYDDYIDDEMLHIVMEYAPLGTLKQHLNKLTTYMREPQVLWLFINIVQGLAFLHEHKVMHRDLKSDNIFICEPFVPKLGDFGVAKRLNSAQPMAVSVVGTPLYLSPELVNGQPYNTKSDIWALGVLLYEMCARRAPFQAGNQGAVIKKILMGEFAPLPKTYSDAITAMVRNCLAQDPALRPSCRDLLALLRQQHEPVGPNLDPEAALEGERAPGGEGEGVEEQGARKKKQEPMWWDWNANNGFVTGHFRTIYGGTPHAMSPINGQRGAGRGGRGGGIQPFQRGGGGGPLGVHSPLVGQRPTSAPSTPSSGNATPMGRDLLDFLVTTPAILEGPLQGPLWRHPKARIGLDLSTPELDEKGEDEWLRDSLGAESELAGHAGRDNPPPLAFTAVDDLTGWLQQYWAKKDSRGGGQEAGDDGETPRRSSTRPTSSPNYSSRDSVHPGPALIKASFNPNKPPSRVLGLRLGPAPYNAPLPAQPQAHVTSSVQPNAGVQPALGQGNGAQRGRRWQLGGSGKDVLVGREGAGEEGRGRGQGKGGEGFERTASTDKERGDMGLQLQGYGINQHLERGPVFAPYTKPSQVGRKGMGGTLERKRNGKLGGEGGEELMLGRPSC